MLKAFIQKQKKEKREHGAIIVEATIALSTFIFAMFTIYSVINVCYVQSKMAVALNSAAKEMSQYAYLYSTLGLDKHMSGEGGKSSELMAGLGKVFSEISGGASYISDDLGEMFDTASAQASGDSLSEYMKNGVGMALAKKLVQKNLVAFEGDTAEAFLKRNKVVNGLDGLSFVYTEFLSNETQDEVDIIVSYKVKVIQFLNIDFEFPFMQRARTKAWKHADSTASGDSSSDGGSSEGQKDERTVWETGPVSRGKDIVDKEKKNYTYTSDSNGFHAFDEKTNEFTRIRSINTYDETYSDPATGQKAIENTLQSTFNDMHNKVDKLGNTVNVQNASGNKVQLGSDPETRKYNIVLVVPEDADLATVNAAVNAFVAEQAANGHTVTVDVKPGYGNHEGQKVEQQPPAEQTGDTQAAQAA